MEDFDEGSLIYDCFMDHEDVDEFIFEYTDDRLSKYFIAVFDPKVSKRQMMKEIIEAVKLSFAEDEE